MKLTFVVKKLKNMLKKELINNVKLGQNSLNWAEKKKVCKISVTNKAEISAKKLKSFRFVI